MESQREFDDFKPSEEEISELLVQLETANVMSKFDGLISALKDAGQGRF